MLLRSATVRDLDRLTARVFESTGRSSGCRLAAYRIDDTFFVDIDLPGADPAGIDVTVDGKVLTVRAERRRAERRRADGERADSDRADSKPADGARTDGARTDRERTDRERADSETRSSVDPASRQVFLSDTLDTDRLEARYDNGVLTLSIPVREPVAA
jgi:HSP20 family protein